MTETEGDIKIEGYDEFCKEISRLEKQGKRLFLLFSGSKDADGKSWCPDCVAAEPIIENAVKKQLPTDGLFVYVGVGTRDEWKDPNSSFRKDCRTKLKCVPTLLHWGTQERLEEAECSDPRLVELLFEES